MDFEKIQKADSREVIKDKDEKLTIEGNSAIKSGKEELQKLVNDSERRDKQQLKIARENIAATSKDDDMSDEQLRQSIKREALYQNALDFIKERGEKDSFTRGEANGRDHVGRMWAHDIKKSRQEIDSYAKERAVHEDSGKIIHGIKKLFGKETTAMDVVHGDAIEMNKTIPSADDLFYSRKNWTTREIVSHILSGKLPGDEVNKIIDFMGRRDIYIRTSDNVGEKVAISEIALAAAAKGDYSVAVNAIKKCYSYLGKGEALKIMHSLEDLGANSEADEINKWIEYEENPATLARREEVRKFEEDKIKRDWEERKRWLEKEDTRRFKDRLASVIMGLHMPNSLSAYFNRPGEVEEIIKSQRKGDKWPEEKEDIRRFEDRIRNNGIEIPVHIRNMFHEITKS